VGAAFGFPPAKVQEAFHFVKTAALGQAARRPLTAGLRSGKALAEGLRLDSLEEAFAKIRKLRN
jgi:hypothetical protein